jgi:phosphate transport system permease protein
MPMTAIAPIAPNLAPKLEGASRRPGDKLFRFAAIFCGLLVLLILAGILASTLNKSFPAIRFAGAHFFTKTWDPTNGKLGGLSLIYGTVVTSAIAIVVAVPVSLGIALFLTEVAPRRLRAPFVFFVDLLAAVPSVVYGLWGAFVLSAPIGTFYGHVSNGVSSIPVLNTLLSGSSGASYMTAGLIVALMIIPIISSLSREVFNTVPSAQKEAAVALGSTRWEMIRVAVLGYGRSGVIGAIMLGLGRAMGETIAVALTIGSVQSISGHLFHSGDALASIIANQFGESTNSFGDSGKVPFQAALIGLGLALFVITVIVNLIARSFIARGERAMEGA